MKETGQAMDLGWCPFCGERFRPSARTTEAYFEGRLFRIHRDEQREFMERGMLKYLESPRSGPSQDALDMLLLASMALGVGVVLVFVAFH